MQRELIVLAIALVLGLVAIPAAVWITGTTVLGPYAGGSTLGALLGNFFKGLGTGARSFWFVALGPYVMILLARLAVALLFGGKAREARAQAPPQQRRAPPSEQQPKRQAPTLDQPRRAAPAAPQKRPPQQASNVRKTPFIKSID